jgi:5-methylcytosine-specific restriction endonuclease McrA
MEQDMAAVLLLNASYEPLSVISQRRALSLLLRGRVETATEERLTINAGSATLGIPTVLRLRRYVHVPRRSARWSRRGVLERDQHTCVYCGIRVGERRRNHLLGKTDFTIDHLIPRSRGGKNTWGNTACACQECNQRKEDRTPHEAGMPLLWEPKTPRVDYLIASGHVPKAWKVYLEV